MSEKDREESRASNQLTMLLGQLQRECAERAMEILPEEQASRLRGVVREKLDAPRKDTPAGGPANN